MKFSPIIGAVIALAISANNAIAADAVKVTPPQQKSLSGSDSARYVFGQISEFRRDQYMLDTRTGRLWVKVCIVMSTSGSKDSSNSDDCIPTLQVVPYSTLDNKVSLTPQ